MSEVLDAGFPIIVGSSCARYPTATKVRAVQTASAVGPPPLARQISAQPTRASTRIAVSDANLLVDFRLLGQVPRSPSPSALVCAQVKSTLQTRSIFLVPGSTARNGYVTAPARRVSPAQMPVSMVLVLWSTDSAGPISCFPWFWLICAAVSLLANAPAAHGTR